MIVPCECGAKLRIDDAKVRDKGIKVRCPRCGNVLVVQKPVERADGQPVAPAVPQPGGPLVLVAHDSEVVRTMISGVLREAGFAVDTARDGHEALSKAVKARPRAMVLDVGLSGIYGFELCERLKGDDRTSAIKIVLLSSVYDMRRYKRKPVSLYGADDYIEKHHIPDFLTMKISKLLQPPESSASKTAESSHEAPPKKEHAASREFDLSLFKPESLMRAEPVPAPAGVSASAVGVAAVSVEMPDSAAISPESLSLESSIFQKEECDIPSVDAADPEAAEKARRFARIIVSDIALYNQDAVVDGLRNGTFYELLKNDVTEGRELYENRVPAAVRAKKDYYQEAFDNFIKTQKKIVR